MTGLVGESGPPTFFPLCALEMAVAPWLVLLLAAPVLVLAASLEHQHLTKAPHRDFTTADAAFVSALGDPGMRSDRVRVAVEGWNFCNRAGNWSRPEVDSGNWIDKPVSTVKGSPRWADCTDLVCPKDSSVGNCEAVQRVSESDNVLGPGDAFRCGGFTAYNDSDSYAIEKEKFLALLCAVADPPRPSWSFWMFMLKNGNYDVNSGLCPLAEERGNSRVPVRKGPSQSGFPCFGPGCMNQPQVFLNLSEARGPGGSAGLSGGFHGTYDLLDTSTAVGAPDSSFFSVNWFKNESGGSWHFHHVLTTSGKYPWLMLYLRADATSGESGGYPWETRGMLQKTPQSPNFKVTFKLKVLKGGGSNSQFYLLDIGGCWKNNGEQCDGDLATGVTRYSEMIINPEVGAACGPNSLQNCPPIHTTTNGTEIRRNDTRNFPYSAYHYYCVPYNAIHAETPHSVCDPYSNPQPQELMQLLPHPEWAVHGYPASKGEGWIGDDRAWDLDVGALSSRLFFYQDPGTTPATRKWPSIDVGTEIYQPNNPQPQTAEWVVSDFNVLLPDE